MALTRRGDGTGAAYLVNSTWWNDYYDLLTGNMPDQPVTIQNTVTLTTQNAQFYWHGTLAGSNKTVLRMSPTDASTKDLRFVYNTSNHLTLYNQTDSKTLIDANPSGNVDFPNGLTNAGATVPKLVNSWSGVKITVSNATPSSPTKGDVWIKTPFS